MFPEVSAAFQVFDPVTRIIVLATSEGPAVGLGVADPAALHALDDGQVVRAGLLGAHPKSGPDRFPARVLLGTGLVHRLPTPAN